MRYFNKVIYIVLFSAVACETDREPLVAAKMEERIAQKIADYERIYKQRCFDELQEEAIRIADSLVREEIQLLPLDSIEKPPKPLKPIYPGSQRNQDSFFVKPLKD